MRLPFTHEKKKKGQIVKMKSQKSTQSKHSCNINITCSKIQKHKPINPTTFNKTNSNPFKEHKSKSKNSETQTQI